MESLFSRLNGKFAKRGKKDRLVRTASRYGAFLVKSWYLTLKLGANAFSSSSYIEFMGHNRSFFLIRKLVKRKF